MKLIAALLYAADLNRLACAHLAAIVRRPSVSNTHPLLSIISHPAARPSFTNHPDIISLPSYEDGSDMLFFSPKSANKLRAQSRTIIGAAVICVFGVFVAVFASKVAMKNAGTEASSVSQWMVPPLHAGEY